MESGSSALSSRRRVILKWVLFVAVAAIAIGLDLLTKHLAEQSLVPGETTKILPFFYLERTANDGVAFGLLGGNRPLIVAANVVALLVVGAYAFMERRVLLAGIAGGMVVGGSIGNMVQRIAGDGHVTDFMEFPHWPNFNLADVFIDVGIAVIVLGLIVEAVRVWRAGRQTPAAR
jgi:signal peptidase II